MKFQPQNIQKICVIQTAFLGDVVLATSILEELHKAFPNADIYMLLRKGNENILQNHPYVKTIIWNKKENKYKELSKIIKTIKQLHFDVVINIQRYFSTGLITALSSAKYTVGFDKNPLSFLFSKKIKHDWSLHETERNHQLIKDFTGFEMANKPKIYPSEIDFENAQKYIGDKVFITLAPASVWFTKQLPVEKWLELISKISKDVKLLLVGGPGDVALCEEIKSKTNHPQIENIAGKLNLLASAALMKQAKMNYTNDSGPMHLASATDAPTRAIFCSTVPAFGFGPLSTDSKIIETNMELDCRPCGFHGHKACPKGHFLCAKTIEFPMESFFEKE